MKPNLNTVVDTIVNEKGVSNVTVGNIVGYQMLRGAVQMLKMAEDQSDYDAYKAIKFAGGEATTESRRDAYKFAMEKASALAVANYNRSLTEEKGE